MKSIIIKLLVFIFLFSKIKSTTICEAISGDLVSVSNCQKGKPMLNNTSCCFKEIKYQNSNLPKKLSCITIEKNIDSINLYIAAQKRLDSSIKDISVDCSNSFLKFTSFILFILLF